MQERKDVSYGVPDLQLDDLAINFNNKGSELDSNGNIVFFFEVVIHDSAEKATLSNAYMDSYAN